MWIMTTKMKVFYTYNGLPWLWMNTVDNTIFLLPLINTMTKIFMSHTQKHIIWYSKIV